MSPAIAPKNPPTFQPKNTPIIFPINPALCFPVQPLYQSAVIFIMLFIMMTKIYFSSFIRQIQHDKHAFLANGYYIEDLGQ